MKTIKLLTVLFSVLLLSCNDSSTIEPPPVKSQFKVISYQNLQNVTGNILSTLKSNSHAYIQEYQGQKFMNLETLETPDGFEYYKKRIFLPSAANLENSSWRIEEVKNYAEDELFEMGFSEQFRLVVSETFGNFEDIESMGIADLESQLINKLQMVSNSAMSEMEKLALTQMLYNTLAIAKSAYTQESNEMTSGRTQGCPVNWKAVAEDAFKAGIAGGVAYGIQGVRAGAIATSAAGNPVVGGIVGGAVGFVVGFVGGAAVGGGAKLVWDCLFTSATKTKGGYQVFTCSGNVYYAYGVAVPTGCTEGGVGIDTGADGPLYDLRNILGINLVPNYGNQSISQGAIGQLNLVL